MKTKAQFSITYETITPESAEIGDFADHGYEYEPGDLETLGEALRKARDWGIYERSCSQLCPGVWWSSVDPEYNREYFEKGEEKRYSLHVDGVTFSTLKRIDRWLRTGKAFKEPSGNPG